MSSRPWIGRRGALINRREQWPGRGPRAGEFCEASGQEGAGHGQGVFRRFRPKRERADGRGFFRTLGQKWRGASGRAGLLRTGGEQETGKPTPPGMEGRVSSHAGRRASTEPARSIVTRRAGSMPMATMAAHAWRLFRADYGAWGVVLPRAVEASRPHDTPRGVVTKLDDSGVGGHRGVVFERHRAGPQRPTRAEIDAKL